MKSLFLIIVALSLSGCASYKKDPYEECVKVHKRFGIKEKPKWGMVDEHGNIGCL